MRKVKVREDQRLSDAYPEGAPGRVTIRMASGETHTREVLYPRGHAKSPMSDADVEREVPRHGRGGACRTSNAMRCSRRSRTWSSPSDVGRDLVRLVRSDELRGCERNEDAIASQERSNMVEFKTISYETVTVGEEFRSDDFLIKPEDVDTYAYAVDDHNPWYFEDSPFGGKIAHPTLLGQPGAAHAPLPLHRAGRAARQDAIRVPRAAARRACACARTARSSTSTSGASGTTW